MGIVGLWPFVRNKGYEADVYSPFLTSKLNDNTISGIHRVDIMASFYSTIRFAYTNHPPDIAHTILESKITSYGIPRSSWLYLDGIAPKEKLMKYRKRMLDREIASQKAQETLKILESIIKERPQSPKGWNIKECPYEADTAIADETMPGDVVISADGDIDQLTVLCIISSNDYNRNVPTLGLVTNFKIVKSLTPEDPATMVQNYLQHEQVISEDVSTNQFEPALDVFVFRKQTKPLTDIPAVDGAITIYIDLEKKFNDLRDLLKERKDEQRALKDQNR
ncbi:hypothetical protein BX616_003918 [Lobosporangium transversale]|nr:hypothetical protein BX616_003918 [Lobosporangium transversale]